MFSRKPKLEMKHQDNDGTLTVTNNGSFTEIITPSNVPLGTAYNQATGRWIKYQRVTLEADFHISGSADPSVMHVPFRVVIASPRVEQSLFGNYFNSNVTFNGGSSIDPAFAHVVYDYIHILPNPWWVPAGATNTPSMSSNPKVFQKIKKYIPHPRKVQLQTDGGILDAKDNLFLIVKHCLPVDPVNSTVVFVGWRSKTSFIDI